MNLRSASTPRAPRSLFGVVLALAIIFGGSTLLYFGAPLLSTTSYSAVEQLIEAAPAPKPQVPTVVHLKTPESVRAIYMTQCVVGTPSFRAELVKLIEETELNAVIIDIKDYSGGIAFPTDVPALSPYVSNKCGAADMHTFVEMLHEKDIYVIGRITVFQDPLYTAAHPELAVKKESDGSVWKDFKGLSFIDVGARPFWDYIVALSKASYALGFDELNFDYIRYPSDGNMKDISFMLESGEIKADKLEQFFEYLAGELKPVGAVLSADLFGYVTVHEDDLGIGQILERAFPYFDYIAPMVYPSHFNSGFAGLQNVNSDPYKVIYASLKPAADRARATTTKLKTRSYPPIIKTVELPATGTTPTTTTEVFTGLYEKPSYGAEKIRPWLQDFDYGGDYDAADVRAQIQATYDAGLTSWMLWSPSNRYTREALERAVPGN